MHSVKIKQDSISFFLFLGLSLIFIMTLEGCASQVRQIRERNVRQYQKSLADRTQKYLQPDQKLGLKDCLQLALQNNLKGQAAEIQARIKKLEKNTAFANFFPTLEIKANYTAWEHQPMQKAVAGYIPTHDKEISEFVLQAQMPIFIPSTWYLYSLYTRGAEIGDLVLDYTKQMITYQVSVMYYQCLILEEMAVVTVKEPKDFGIHYRQFIDNVQFVIQIFGQPTTKYFHKKGIRQ